MSTEHLLGEFGPMLDALMGAAEEPRKNAEKYLRDLTVSHPGDVLLLLAQIGAMGVGGFQLDHRFLALILLNRLSFRPLPGLFLNPQEPVPSSPFDCIAERHRSRIETAICTGLKDEMNIRMRKGLGTCAAGWAEESSRRQRPVMPLPPILIELTARKEAFHRFTPYQVITLFPTLLIDSVQVPLPASQFAQILLAGLHDPSVDVRVEALKAVEAVLTKGMTAVERQEVGPTLIMAAFTIIPQLPVDTLKYALLPLADLSWDYPELVQSSITPILTLIFPLMSPPNHKEHSWSPYHPPSAEYDDWTDYANPAQEILCALAYNHTDAVMAWDNWRAVREVIPMLMGRMVAQLVYEGEDQSDWLKEEDVEIGEYPASSPQEIIQRLAMSLSSAEYFGRILEQLQLAMSTDQSEWEVICAGLLCFAPALSESSAFLKGRLQEIITLVAKCASHPHPRVRYAFLHCIGELCHAARSEVKFGTELVQLCITNLADPVERVRAQATTTLTDVISTVPENKPCPFNLRNIVEALCNCYNASQPFVKERVLANMSDLETRVVGDVDFVRALAEFYIRILSQSGIPAMRKVIGRAIECATVPVFLRAQYKHPELGRNLVALAEMLLRHQNDLQGEDDIRSRYIVDGWMAFSKAIKADFAPFLPFAIPHTLRLAKYVPPRHRQKGTNGDTSLTQDDDAEEDELDDWGDIPDLYDKAGAMNALAAFGVEVGKGMGEWMGEAIQIGVEGLGSRSRGVRANMLIAQAACALIPSMLSVALTTSQQINIDPLLRTLLVHLKRLDKAEDTPFDLVALHLKSFLDCIRIIAQPLPQEIITLLLEALTSHLGCIAELIDMKQLKDEERIASGYTAPEDDWDSFESLNWSNTVVGSRNVMEGVLGLAAGKGLDAGQMGGSVRIRKEEEDGLVVGDRSGLGAEWVQEVWKGTVSRLRGLEVVLSDE